MNKYFLSIKDRKGEFKKYEVQEEVYIYVGQLEAYIKYPKESKMLELNPHLKGADNV